MENKLDIRREVRRRVSELSVEQKAEAARDIFERVEHLDDFVNAGCVASYAAMRDEVPTAEILDRWLALGKRVVVPRVEGDIMHFYDYSPTAMQSGAYGISEPTSDNPCSAADIDLIVVPARAFTISGIRLGRGGGFYDKYMSMQNFRAYKVGVAFLCQRFDELPFDNHDITVDKVIFG